MIAVRWAGGALGLLGRYATWLLFAGVFLGIAVPPLAALFKPLFLPSVVGLLTVSLLRLEVRDVLAITRRPGLLLLAFVWILVVAPVAMTLLLTATDLPEQIAIGLVLCAGCPPIMSSIAFAFMFRLDAPLVTMLVFPTIALVPLTLPPLVLVLLGLELEIALGEFMLRLGAIVAGSMLLAAVVRALVPKARIDAAALHLDGIAVIMMLIFAVAVMDGVGPRLLGEAGLVALTLAMAIAANVGMQAAATGMFWAAGRKTALSIGFASGNRNMGLLLAALGGTAHPDLMLFIAMAQLPIYMLPLGLKPIYLRLSGASGLPPSPPASPPPSPPPVGPERPGSVR